MQVLATSGVWDVMTPQEAVDFVQQCRACRPDNLSCSAALTLEAHTRWKLRFSKVGAASICCKFVYLPNRLLQQDAQCLSYDLTTHVQACETSLQNYWAKS